MISKTTVKIVFSAYLFKGIVGICRIVTVPIFLKSLPNQECAVLAILGGMEGWFLLLDFGLGGSVQNTFAENEVKKLEEGPFLKSSFIFSLIASILGIGLIFLGQSFFSSFFFDRIDLQGKEKSIFLLASCFLLIGTWGTIGTKILVAKQKVNIVYCLQILAHLFSLVCIIVSSVQGSLSLEKGIFFSIGIPAIVSAILSIKIFYKINWKERIQWILLHRAWKFWTFAVLAAFVTLSDTLVIVRTLELSEIIEYNVLCKVFGIASFAYAAFMQPLMPRCSQMLLLGQVKETEKVVLKHCLIGLLGIVLFTIIIIGMKPFLEKMFGVSLGFYGICFFGAYLCIKLIGDFYAMALQSHSLLKPFFYWVPVQAALSLFFQYFLSLHFRLIGILIGLSLSYILTMTWVLPRKLRGLQRI